MTEEAAAPNVRVTVQVEFPDGARETYTYPNVYGFKFANEPNYGDRDIEPLRPLRETERVLRSVQSCAFSLSGVAVGDSDTELVYTVEAAPARPARGSTAN